MSEQPFNVDQPTNNPLVDEETFTKLANILGSGPDGIDDLVDTFSQDGPETLDQMREAAQDGDMEALANASHKLKGEAGTFGARRLQALCKALELEARDGDVDAPTKRIDEVEAVLEQTLAALHEHV